MMKKIEQITVNESELDALVKRERQEEIQKQVEEMNGKISALCDALEDIDEKCYGWIKIKNKNVYYHTGIGAVLPNLATFQLGKCNTAEYYDSNSFLQLFEGYTGRLPEKQEIQTLFGNISTFHEEKVKSESESDPAFVKDLADPAFEKDLEDEETKTIEKNTPYGNYVIKHIKKDFPNHFTVKNQIKSGEYTVNREGNNKEQWGIEIVHKEYRPHGGGPNYFASMPRNYDGGGF